MLFEDATECAFAGGGLETTDSASAIVSGSLAFTTEQAGRTCWLVTEAVGTQPLSERCVLPGGSGVLKEPEDSVKLMAESSAPGENPVVSIVKEIRLITSRSRFSESPIAWIPS